MGRKTPPGGIKNHFTYFIWAYVVIALVSWFVGDLLFTMTEYRPPDSRKVDFQIVQAAYVPVDHLEDGIAPALLKVGQAFDETLQAVEFYGITYNGDPEKDIYGAQKYAVMLAAQEGDIWVVSEQLMNALAQMGTARSLDDYVQGGVIDTQGLDLSGCVLPEYTGDFDDAGAPVLASGTEHLYALPLAGCEALKAIGCDTENSFAVLMRYSKNPGTSAAVLDSLIRNTYRA